MCTDFCLRFPVFELGQASMAIMCATDCSDLLGMVPADPSSWAPSRRGTPPHTSRESSRATTAGIPRGLPPILRLSPATARPRSSTRAGPCSPPWAASLRSSSPQPACNLGNPCGSRPDHRSPAREGWITWATLTSSTRRASWPSGARRCCSWAPSRATATPRDFSTVTTPGPFWK